MPSRRGKRCLPPVDLTKIWLHRDYPLIEVGEFELNRNPRTFAEVEQSGCRARTIVPASGASPDKMLQARLFNVRRCVQRYRLGVNHHHRSRSTPRAARAQQTTATAWGRADGNHGGTLALRAQQKAMASSRLPRSPPLKTSEGNADWNHREDGDYHQQPGDLFRLMTLVQQAGAVRQHHARDGRCAGVHRAATSTIAEGPAYGAGVARRRSVEIGGRLRRARKPSTG